MASFCLRPISEPSRSLHEFRTPTYCFEMAVEELMVNFKTWSIWTGTLCIHKSDLVQVQEEKNRDLHHSCLYTPGARQGTHAHALVRGFYNARVSGLAEAGSLTTRLNISPSLCSCGIAALTPARRGPSAVYVHQHVLCLVTWESQGLPFSLQIWHQLTASENWALLPASPEVNFPWRVGTLKRAFSLYKLNSHATSGTCLYTVRYSGWKVVPLITAGHTGGGYACGENELCEAAWVSGHYRYQSGDVSRMPKSGVRRKGWAGLRDLVLVQWKDHWGRLN